MTMCVCVCVCVCVLRDVLCGKLQCQGGTGRPVLSSGAEILTTKVQFNHSDLVCRGTYLDLGDDVSDPASVAQGTACAPHRVGPLWTWSRTPLDLVQDPSRPPQGRTPLDLVQDPPRPGPGPP